jgi:hypothetical protein
MRSCSPGSRRRSVRLRAACQIGFPAVQPGTCPRWLLWGALLALGLCRALGVQAAEVPRTSESDPRPATPSLGSLGSIGEPGPATAAANTAAAAAVLLAPLGPLAPHPPKTGIDQASLCQGGAAEASTAGSVAAVVAAAGPAPPDACRGLGDDLPVAAEPPPLVTALGLPAGPAGPPGSPGQVAAGPLPAPATSAQPAQPAAAPPPPQLKPRPPRPHPALGFDASARVPRRPFGKLIYQIARNYALNPLLVAAIAKVESDFNPRARSRKGACGLMQVLPATARRFGLQRRRDLFNPRKNIEAASRYLRWLVDRFGDDPIRVLAAYNAGEGAVDRFGGVPPFAETRGYVTRIFSLLGFSALLDAPVAAAPAAEVVPLAAAAAAAALVPGASK